MKPQPAILVVDAPVLIAAALGRSTSVLFDVGDVVSLVTTERAVQEARRRIELGMRRPELLPALEVVVGELHAIGLEDVASSLGPAQTALRDSIPSRNGSVSDAHILALAWEADAEIWSHDRDFAGTGVASWSTLNLSRALAESA